jgi:hypothetical protein
MPISAMLRTSGGRPPSISPVPCNTLDPIMAPNIQLAGNFAIRSNNAVDTEAPIRPISPSGEATLMVRVGAEEEVIPVSVSSKGRAAVRTMTRMVCTTAIADTSAPFSMARIVICDSAPGLAARNAEVRSQP